MSFIVGTTTIEISAFFIIVCVLALLLILRIVRKRTRAESTEEADQAAHVTISSPKDIKKIAKRGTLIPTIRVSGPILSSSIGLPPFTQQFATYADRFVQQMEMLEMNDDVKAVIVEFITPGGSVLGSSMIGDAIEKCDKKKPVYALVGDISASGGVWAMISARQVFAQPGSLVGSIGVLGPTLLTYKDVIEQRGVFGSGVVAKSITGRTLYAGAGKALGDPFTPPDEHGISAFQRTLNASYEMFVNRVARYRNRSADSIKNMGAAILDAASAQAEGLVDMIMTRDRLEQHIAEQLKVKPDACVFPVMRKSARKMLSFSFAPFEAFTSYLAEQHIRRALSRQGCTLLRPNYFE